MEIMESYLEKLTEEERSVLMKAPVLVSLLAAATDGVIDNAEKAKAREVANMRTFSADPELRPYYREAQKMFDDFLENYTIKDNRIDEDEKKEIEQELDRVHMVLCKMDEEIRRKLYKSFRSYGKHVAESHNNFIFSALLPIEIPGITDK